ncbi:MAG: hypothetical protein KAU20_00840 [Nanoarchaeota archaeon]|nr:hypothetical protein [Nanoarchaeota archaeon]
MKIIKSSEIASYLFCPVSWWIGITKGVKITKKMIIGEKHHKTISENQTKANFLYIFIIIAVIIIISLLLYRFLT